MPLLVGSNLDAIFPKSSDSPVLSFLILRDDPDLIYQHADDPIRDLVGLVCKRLFYPVLALLSINFDTKHRLPYSLMPYIRNLSYFGIVAIIFKHTFSSPRRRSPCRSSCRCLDAEVISARSDSYSMRKRYPATEFRPR